MAARFFKVLQIETLFFKINTELPEFIQDAATPDALAEALLQLQQDAAAQRRQVAKFHEIHMVLRQNTAQKAADAVLAVIDAGGR